MSTHGQALPKIFWRVRIFGSGYWLSININENNSDPILPFSWLTSIKITPVSLYTRFMPSNSNYRIAIRGGVVAISIAWNCNLDRDFMSYCLPHYTFRILDDFGWNFRHAKYHEEHRRSLYKMYGIKFIVNVEGQGGKFNLKNTILNIGSGLALLGVSTVVCDFLLMYIKEKGVVKKKK